MEEMRPREKKLIAQCYTILNLRAVSLGSQSGILHFTPFLHLFLPNPLPSSTGLSPVCISTAPFRTHSSARARLLLTSDKDTTFARRAQESGSLLLAPWLVIKADRPWLTFPSAWVQQVSASPARLVYSWSSASFAHLCLCVFAQAAAFPPTVPSLSSLFNQILPVPDSFLPQNSPR